MPRLYKTLVARRQPLVSYAHRISKCPNDLILEKIKFLLFKIRKRLVHKYFFIVVQIRWSTIDSRSLPKNFIIREGNNSKHVTGCCQTFPIILINRRERWRKVINRESWGGFALFDFIAAVNSFSGIPSTSAHGRKRG